MGCPLKRAMTLGVRQMMLGGTAVSIILGMAVGAAISFDDPSGLRLTSISGGGLILDVFFVVVAVVVVLYAIWLSATLNATALVICGSVLLIAGLGGPSIVNHVSHTFTINTQSRTSFVILAILEFLGGAFLAAGLLDFIRGGNRQTLNRRGRTDASAGDDK